MDVITRIDYGEYSDWRRANEAAETIERSYHELAEDGEPAAQ